MSDVCAVQVGTHTEPYWKDNNSDLIVCSRHRDQYNERADELGPFDWASAESAHEGLDINDGYPEAGL